jgi:hypothetical protein
MVISGGIVIPVGAAAPRAKPERLEDRDDSPREDRPPLKAIAS